MSASHSLLSNPPSAAIAADREHVSRRYTRHQTNPVPYAEIARRLAADFQPFTAEDHQRAAAHREAVDVTENGSRAWIIAVIDPRGKLTEHVATGTYARVMGLARRHFPGFPYVCLTPFNAELAQRERQRVRS